jgi:uncharacterized protein
VIVFCNTTPIIALSSVGLLDLLPDLFGDVHLAEAVLVECERGGLIPVSNLRHAGWVKAVPAAELDPEQRLMSLWELDAGERDTILGALALHADRVLIDERLGRMAAEYLGRKVTGTLGILLLAKRRGRIKSFLKTAAAMRRQGIHYSASRVQRLAAEVGEE